VRRRFVRGKEKPQGVVWFGARSFWGHIRHLIAAAIASDNIDSRAWMTPDDPDILRGRILKMLGGDPGAANLIDGLGRELYIDFVADTGDDVAVSRAVARLVFASYELPDPDRPGQLLTAPRGDILFFGGDTAYPVGTAHEILNRVIVPWNQVLAALPEDGDRRRVLLGIPGNHDWYDGLDGFSRMFRRRPDAEEPPAPLVGVSSFRLLHDAEWARQFVHGTSVDKPEALVLAGYAPVQNGSHFALRLAPGIDLLAADRQLTEIDPRQRRFLETSYRDDASSATLVVLPDPVHLFGDPSKTGMQMVESLRLQAAARQTFVLTGDIHHYERSQRGEALHVIAGGGGAFLHPARVAKGGLTPAVSWPGVAQSRLLLRGVPWKLACGRSGLLPHLCLLLLYAPHVLFGGRLLARVGGRAWAVVGTTILLGVVFALLGGITRPRPVPRPVRRSVLPLALAAAVAAALIPVVSSLLLGAARPHIARVAPPIVASMVVPLLVLAAAAFAGTFVFGGMLTLFTLFGHEHMQALTALDHPGFKHFVRLRVRADGSGIDGWCIGAADPLRAGAQPELVDQFAWRPFSAPGR
jgi:hypothetical protein